ncbi:GNAT family N-acetyltransferase [Rubrobacter taiwanensis]|uniref:GNAT family N-acetyltransferase n=1 Tax=Rubrobacter taiwanensis TaxID=185139 RepID=A0A4R1BRY5_9ACTN|nr:GNAT family N-acetyltransferase [Rubrobacter taiwanensis]TCJ20510.1 GNAT family N-acetyltransferase [Rubrobacter taiwanensis]
MRGAEAVRVRPLASIEQVEPSAWRALEPPDFPFFDHEFLRALERSGSVGKGSGWSPVYLVCTGGGQLLGALPLYVKTDSFGEYIFDWDWAHAYHQHGLSYYPKLVAAVPFTPATGPKLLVRPGADRAAVADALLGEARRLGEEVGVSSSHALFLPEGEVPEFTGRGFALRHSMQFHWRNRGYGSFQDYLSALKGKRRGQIRRERRQLDGDLAIESLTGEALYPGHAAAMYEFYISTSEKKWGSPYLTRAFFEEVFRTMRDRILFVVARAGGRPVAGALSFFKGDSLYGRYWGATVERRNLHFELCYYRPVEFAIERRLGLFEAGAQGEHKLARGFLPTLTYSAHEIRHPLFRRAIEQYIEEEKEIVAENLAFYSRHSPYKDGKSVA